jgi:hypothetical protein
MASYQIDGSLQAHYRHYDEWNGGEYGDEICLYVCVSSSGMKSV